MGTLNNEMTVKHADKILSAGFDDNIMSVVCSCSVSRHTLSGHKLENIEIPGRLTIQLSSPANNIIKVKILSHRKGEKETPFVDIRDSGNGAIEEDEDNLIFKSGMLEARINKEGAPRLSYFFCGVPITRQSHRSGAFYATSSGAAQGYRVTSGDTFIGETLINNAGEIYYGLGGGATLVRNGSKIEMMPTATPAQHANVPFFVTSSHYGIFVNTPGAVNFVMGGVDSEIKFYTTGEYIEYEIFAGNTISECISLFTQVIGRPFQMSADTLGFAINVSDNFELNADEIIAYLRHAKDSGINVTELWLGNSWRSYEGRVGFKWDGARFPDPGKFIRGVHERGVKLGLAVSPYVSDTSAEFDECVDMNYLLKDRDGDIILHDCDAGAVAVIDVSNLAARNWIGMRIDDLMKEGVDFIEGDFRYKLLDEDDDIGKDETFYTSFAGLFNQMVYDSCQRVVGKDNVLMLADSAASGDGNLPCRNIYAPAGKLSFGDLTVTLASALSQGMSGFPYINLEVPDIAGGDPDLFARWLQLAMFAPHLTVNVSADREFAAGFSAEVFEMLKTFASMRGRLAPYIFSAAREAAGYGSPVMRPMGYEFPADSLAQYATQQYMFGSSLMVAPVMRRDGSVRFYVPAGIWTNLFTGERIQGPRFATRKEELSQMPVYVRPNTVLTTANPTDTGASHGNSAFLDNVTFTCFELSDGRVAAAEIFSENGKQSGIVNVLKQGKKITVKTDGFGKNKRVILMGIPNVASVSESFAEPGQFGTTIEFSGDELVIGLE